MSFIASALTGKVAGNLAKFGAPIVSEALRSVLPGPTAEKVIAKMMPEYMKRAQEMDMQLESQRVDILKSEANSESWLTANVRPLTMLVLVLIIGHNYLLVPLCNTFLFPAIQFFLNLMLFEESHVGAMKFREVVTPPEAWDLIKIYVPGYVGARTVDKGFQAWKSIREVQARATTIEPAPRAPAVIPPDAPTRSNVAASYSIEDLPIRGSD